MKFLKNVLAVVVGFFVVFTLLFALFFAIGIVASGEKTIKVRDNSILKLNITSRLKDYTGTYTFENGLYSYKEYGGLNDILAAIAHAEKDPKIKGISIVGEYNMAGMAQLQSIRNKLEAFKKSGKFVYAYGDFYTQKNYYLSTVADSVYLNPLGNLDFKGLATELLFFKDFQEKYGIKMIVLRHGKYKSFGEPFLSNKMSPANREQITTLLQSVWNTMLTDISKSRKISIAALNTIADNLSARTPEMALQHRLIDNIAYRDSYVTALKKAVGITKDRKLHTIDIEEYAESIRNTKTGVKDKIAVIFAQGGIIYGKGNENFIGQGIINDALKKARKNKQVKAIVLRINSGGGSALASELIWREMELTKKEKPVVVSMGNLAASGGYYIACNADRIFAEPATITGSIGVFGMLPNVEQFAHSIGINADQAGTNKNAMGYSAFEKPDKHYEKILLEAIDRIYNTFLRRVADGRAMPVSKVEDIAQGRVWSGAEAVTIGLVDALGGLDDAIEEAAKMANITDYKIRNYPVYKKNFKDLLEEQPFFFKTDVKEKLLKEVLGDPYYKTLQHFRHLMSQKGVQAQIPWQIRFY